jgi:hypothetical protein
LNERVKAATDNKGTEYHLKESLQTYAELIEWVRPTSIDTTILMKKPRFVKGEGKKKRFFCRICG